MEPVEPPVNPPPALDPEEALPACKATKNVSTAQQLTAAIAAAQPGDCIVAADGQYAAFTISAKGTADAPIVIRAQNRLAARITGGTMKMTGAAHVVLEGFDVNLTGSFEITDGCKSCRVSRCKWASGHNKWIQVLTTATTDARIDHCDFGNMAQTGNYVHVGDSRELPQRTRIDRNYFYKNGPRVTNGKEAIRIGISSSSLQKASTIVEYNLFEDCDGDPEIISVKSGGNIVRFNTIRHSQGLICHRHGNDGEIYGNFIFGDGKAGTGGIRVYGKNHKVYNNFITGTTGKNFEAALALHAGDATDGDELNKHHQNVNVQLVNNTLVNTASGIEVGNNVNSYKLPPMGCTVANNVVLGTAGALLTQFSGSGITYANNLVFASGASAGTLPAGTTFADPGLQKVGEVHRLAAGSAAIDKGMAFPFLTEDFERQPRSGGVDIGADELSSAAAKARPLTTADVGPMAP